MKKRMRNDIEILSYSQGRDINAVLHNPDTSFNVTDETRTALMTVQKDGKVGIGTENPEVTFQIVDSATDASIVSSLRNTDATGAVEMQVHNDLGLLGQCHKVNDKVYNSCNVPAC